MSLRNPLKVFAAATALTLAAAVPAYADIEAPEESTSVSTIEDGTPVPSTPEPAETPTDDVTADQTPTTPEQIVPADAPITLDDAPASPEETPGGTAAAASGTIRIGNITDFHGRIAVGNPYTPAYQIACYVEANESNPNFYLTSSGDNIGASLFVSSAENDYPTLDILKALGLKVSAVGNHEFDKGWADFDPKAEYAAAGTNGFTYLGANMQGGNSTKNVGNYTIETIGGVKVAFIGAITEELPSLIAPSILNGVTLNPIATSVNAIADDLKTTGQADVVVALIHEDPTVYASQLSSNVDVVFGGHSHIARPSTATSPTVFIQSGNYGEYIGQVDITVTDGKVTAIQPELLNLIDLNSKKPNEVKAKFTGNECSGAVRTEVATLVQQATTNSTVIGSQPAGHIAGSFLRATATDGSTENRGEESTVGNLVADAQLWAARQTAAFADTQISFMNPGGLRTDILYSAANNGLVTLGQAAQMQPFANTLFVMNLTGADIKQVLNQQVQPDGASRPYLKLGISGLTYTYDPDTFAVTDVWLASGEPIDPAKSYRIVTNSFLKDGGDNFKAFTNGKNVADTGLVDLDAFMNFMKANESLGNVLDPSGSTYAPQRAWAVKDISTTGSDDIKAGQTIALKYSGLWFTNGESSNAQKLTVYFDGQQVGYADITRGLEGVDPKDPNALKPSYGQATVTFTVPDLSGYKSGDQVSFQVRAGDQVLTDWTYKIAASTGGNPTKDPTATPSNNGQDNSGQSTQADKSAQKVTKKLPKTGAETGGIFAAGMVLISMGAAVLVTRRKFAEAEVK